MAADRLFQLCQTILDYAIEALDTLPLIDPPIDGLVLDGAPTRSFVSPGLPATECCADGRPLRGSTYVKGQLAVWVESQSEMATSPLSPPGAQTIRPGVTGRVNLPLIVVQILRCVPVGTVSKPPSPDALTLAAAQNQADGFVLWEGLWHAQHQFQAFASLCDGMNVQQAQVIPAEGGCAGWMIPIQPVVQGFSPYPGS